MELVRILSAGVVRFVDATVPQGVVLGQDIARAIAEEYRFWTFPMKPEEFNLDDSNVGATFSSGVFNNVPVKRLRLFRRGISVELEDHDTAVANGFIDQLLEFGKAKFGFSYANASEAIQAGFNSSLEIRMSDAFGQRFEGAKRIASAIDSALSSYGFKDHAYQLTGLTLAPADDAKPLMPGRFIVEPRANFPLGSQFFFSQAPLSTSDHIKALELMDQAF